MVVKEGILKSHRLEVEELKIESKAEVTWEVEEEKAM
jgi:hypothetical protein